MNQEHLWRMVVRNNPRFDAETFPMTPALLRKFLDMTWKIAWEKGYAKAQREHDAQREFDAASNPLMDLLKGMK